MIKSKEWNWQILDENEKKIWLEPSIPSFYLIERWKKLKKKNFLDLGCGLGRHTVLFSANKYKTYGFDLSSDGINKTRKYLEQENLKASLKVGDMLTLPYHDEMFDCILCYNVISHTDTQGVKKIIKELERVLKDNGEIYLTLCSKNTWGFKQADWPMVDENTRIRMDDGPEKGIPHFYADYDLIKELFHNFEIIFVNEIKDYYEKNGKTNTSSHYHLLLKKTLH